MSIPGQAMTVNLEVDGIHHEILRKKNTSRLRDQLLCTQGIPVVRITATGGAASIDAAIRKSIANLYSDTPSL